MKCSMMWLFNSASGSSLCIKVPPLFSIHIQKSYAYHAHFASLANTYQPLFLNILQYFDILASAVLPHNFPRGPDKYF